MKPFEGTKKLYYTSQNDSSWNIKKIEFKEKLKELNNVKSDLLKQKEKLDRLGKNPISIENTSVIEANLISSLSQQEVLTLKQILDSEREKIKGIEKELGICKGHCKDLENKNRYAQSLLTEKDRMLSRYLCEMLILKQEVENLIKPSTMLSNNINNSLGVLYTVEKKLEYMPIESKPEEIKIVPLKSAEFYEDEISRLKNQLQETQELYKQTHLHLKNLKEKALAQETEISKLQSKLQETKTEFSMISSQIIRNNIDRDLQSKGLMLEVEGLRKKRADQDQEINKIEQKYKISLEEAQTDLLLSHQKTLEMIEYKTKLENDIIGLKTEKKELASQLNSKDLKISDLNSSLQSTIQELNVLANFINSKNTENSLKIKSKEKYEQKISEITKENTILKGKIESYEKEKAKLASENKINSKNIVQQLSNIILSRGSSGYMEDKDITRNLSRILIENRSLFDVNFN
jgi:chromosome segregation ATPase